MQSVEYQTHFLNGLIALAILIRIVVIARCIALGELKRYRFFCVLLLYGILGSIVSLSASRTNYNIFWIDTRWLEALVGAGAAIEAFWGLARHFRNIRGFGWILITLIAGVSAGAAAIVGALRSNWSSVLRGGFLVGQFVFFALLLTALLSVAFFRQFRKMPVRPNAIVHFRSLGLLYGINSIGYFVGQFTKTQWPFRTSLILIVSPIVTYLWWLSGMKPAGELLPFEAPVMSDEEYDATESGHKRTADQLKQAADEALKKTFRSSRNPKRDWRFWRRR